MTSTNPIVANAMAAKNAHDDVRAKTFGRATVLFDEIDGKAKSYFHITLGATGYNGTLAEIKGEVSKEVAKQIARLKEDEANALKAIKFAEQYENKPATKGYIK